MSLPINPSTISRRVQGDLPELGPVLGTGQRRALLGWNHFKDNARGLSKGKIWCWVSQPDPEKFGQQPKLQVYDTEGNRAPFPGMRVDCGVANFSMVRMFHPYWCPNKEIPQDMNSEDKKQLRTLCHELIAATLLSYANGEHDEDSDHDDDYDSHDDDDAPARRERRARDAEETRQLHEADQRGVRGSAEWKQQMDLRRERVMRAEFKQQQQQAANNGNPGGNVRQRRNLAARIAAARTPAACAPATRTPAARSSAAQSRNRSTNSRRSGVRSSLIRERVRQRRDTQHKTATPGTSASAYQYVEDLDHDAEGDAADGESSDIPHGGEVELEEQRYRAHRAALTRDAFLDTQIDLLSDLDVDGSHRGSAERNSEEDQDSSSQGMFFESANSGDSDRERHSRRHDSAGSSIPGTGGNPARQTSVSEARNDGLRPPYIPGTGRNPARQATAGEARNVGSRSHSALSDTSHRTIKSEESRSNHEVLQLFTRNTAHGTDRRNVIKVEDEEDDDNDVVMTGERSVQRPVPLQGPGSRDDPMTFD